MLDPATTPLLLKELNDALAIEGAEPVEWIICGGTALSIRRLVARTTRDLDVISGWSTTALEVVPLEAFPPPVERAIDRVAAAHPELRTSGTRWVNLGARGLLTFGLPPGFTARLTRLRVGDRLALEVPDRRDLVALKLLAAVDPLQRRQTIHQADFRTIDPEDGEIRFAIDWVATIPDPNHQIRAELREFLQELGRDDLAYYVA